MMNQNKITVFMAAIALIASVSVFSHKGATGVIKQRMDSMSDMGDAMKTMADMIKQKTEFDANTISASASILADHSTMIVDYFPDTEESRESKESEALPAIWESWDRFGALADKLVVAVDTLKQAAESELNMHSFRLVFTKTAKACSSCHDEFRKPKE